jgi:hypothetical protein
MSKTRWQEVRLWYRDGQEVKSADVRTAYLREYRREGDMPGAFLVDPTQADNHERLPDGTHLVDAGPKVDEIDWTDFPSASS